MMKILIPFITMFLLTGCSSILSQFDGTQEVWNFGMDIESVPTPEGFVVSPQEAREFLPGAFKPAMGIFADSQNYFLYTANFGMPYNSFSARKYGRKLSGVDRALFEEQRKNRIRDTMKPEAFMELIRKVEKAEQNTSTPDGAD